MRRTVTNMLLARLAMCLCLTLPAACERFPRDARDSLATVLEAGVLQVGLMHAPPWVDLRTGEEPRGFEVRLLQAFAGELGVRIEWREDGMEALVEALERGDLQVIAGGLTDASPWKRQTGFTLPYFVTVRERPLLDKRYKHVLAAPRGESALVMRLEDYLLKEVGRAEMMRLAAAEGVE